MSSHKPVFSFVFAGVFLAGTLLPATVNGQSSADSLQIHNVIKHFQEAIASKDSTSFHELFFSSIVPFTGIMSEATEASIKKDYPEFQGIAVSDQRRFIRDICLSDRRDREFITNEHIEVQGNISSVMFDYAYYSNDRLIQWGHEKWNLVKAEGSWFITDVIYSIRFPDIETCTYCDQ